MNYGQTSEYSLKRATAHLGLLIFSHLVTSNNGYFYVSSCGNNRKDIYPKEETSFKYFHIGTNYQVLLEPLHKNDNDNLRSIAPVSQQSAEDVLSIEKLLSWEIDGNKECIFINLTLQQKINIEDELWTNFQNAICSKKLGKKNIFVCFNQIEKKINSSQLFRFLGKWEIFFQEHNLVIYDIDINLYFELYEINKSFVSQTNTLPYWNTNAISLFYCFIKIKNNKFYFTDALWGKDPIDFIFINTLIHKNNYNALFHHPDFSENKDNPRHSLDNKIFVNDSTLLPFDLIIKDEDETTLFEKNAKVLLNNELKLQKDSQKEEDNPIRHIENQIHNLPGFKIKDTHFRLGSKIHITDFYYAKRFFQNSFYASRFAFIVTKYILKEQLLKKKYNELTLVGYGLYSELLLSTVVRYISKYYEQNKISKIKINHNLYTDTEEMNLVKGYEEIYKNIIIIVPIASTFSTSMKIAETLKERNKNINIINPHINILAITNGDIKLKGKIPQNAIEKKYGWNEVFPKEKTVDVISFNSGENISQKYFIPLESKWYDIENCVKCSPQKVENNCKTNICNDCNKKNILDECPLSEQSLLMTDKTSVTPTLIFDFPRAREIFEENKNRKYKLSLKALKYGHIERNYQHFHYHIIDEVFLKDNPEISNWLKEEVANKIKSKIINYDVTDNVLIIAPKHFSNSQFVQMVNDLLFDNSANILHYDFWNNSIENFQMFYSKTVCDAKKIFFVDDTIISGSTFLRSNDFIKQTRNHNDNEKNCGFDACFFLINRTNNFTQTNIFRKLEDKSCIFSFANINLPALDKNINGKCPICLNYDKIIKLFEDSYLYRFKNEFAERIKSIKLEGITSTTSNNENKEQAENNKPFENYNQNLIKVEFIHRIYEYFRTEKNQSDFDNYNNIDEWYKHLISETKTPFIKSYIKENNDNNISSNTDILLKVLAHSPFNQYKPIKEKVFKWTILSLNEQVEYLKNSNFENCDYLEFRRLKYFIRRVGLINSNYLISERFFHFITLLYNRNWLERIIEKKNNEKEELKKKNENGKEKNLFSNKEENEIELKKIDKEYESIKENINNFSTFIISQIKELLFQNETRCILLEKYIEDNLTKLEEQKESSFDLKQFFRILKEENGVLIQKFWEFYKKQNELEFEKIAEQNHYQYNTLCDFLMAANEDNPIKNKSLETYLKTQSIFEKYKNNGINNTSIEEKTNDVCRSLKTLFFSEKENNNGTFLLVKYRQGDKAKLNDLFLAYNSGKYSQIIEDKWQEDNYIKKFIDGVINGKNTSITIDLLEKQTDLSENKNITWKSLFSIPNDENIKINFFEKCENINYVLIARLALKEIDDNSNLIINQQGVIVFYSDKNVFTPSKTRYLILLLKSTSTFINEHHKNDEFRDWVESKKINTDLKAIREAYESRFDKFNHGAKRFFKDWDKLYNNNDSFSITESYAISQIIKSQVLIGHAFSDYINTETRNKNYPDCNEYKNFKTNEIKDIKKIIDGISSYYKKKRDNNFNICIEQDIQKIKTIIPFKEFKKILLELICNAISGGAKDNDNTIIIDFDEESFIVKSKGRDSKTVNVAKLLEHLNGENYQNKNYGIGLFSIQKYLLTKLHKGFEIEADNNNWFIIKVPLKIGEYNYE